MSSKDQAPDIKPDQAPPKKRGRFLPGVSGNPAGRPGGYAEFRAACRRHSDETVKMLASASMAGDVQAARVLLEYAWGKPSSAPEDLEARSGLEQLLIAAAARVAPRR